MMRSLFSGVAGLKVHQTKMDVIGNNISNVNTVGFKSSTVNFSDILYQTTQAASGPNAETQKAGMNAKQIGLGASLAAITTNITGQGGQQRTDNPFDLMITGDNFFVVNSGGTNYFTKAGAFNVDAAGTLCTPSGASVMGWQVDRDKGVIEKGVVSPLQVMSAENLYAEPEATTNATVTGNIDQNAVQLQSDEGYPLQVSFYDNLGNKYTAKFGLKTITGEDAEEGNKNTFNLYLQDITDANNESIYATKGEDGTYILNEAPLGVNFGLGGEEEGTEGGTPESVDQDTGKPIWAEDAEPIAVLTYNTNTGKFVGINTEAIELPAGDEEADYSSLSITLSSETLSAEDNLSPFRTVSVDFSATTMFEDSGKISITAAMGAADGSTGAGRKVGSLTEVAIDNAGKIYGNYDNGDSKLLGQIAVASFANPSGLEAVGNNMFAETQNSGSFDGIGEDPGVGGGGITTGVLEMSNVDLSTEFTTMITTQRGFQANSRTITTSDTMLEELINLKR